LEEVVEAYCVEYVAQKARKKAEVKIKEETEKRKRKNEWSISSNSRMRY